MLTTNYIVTGTMNNRTRFWLRQNGDTESLYMATGFTNDASRFRERQKAQIVADRENALATNGAKVWRGIDWQVEQVTVEFNPTAGTVRVVEAIRLAGN